MRGFVRSASRYMPRLRQAGQLSFESRTEQDPPGRFRKFVEEDPQAAPEGRGGGATSS